MSGILCKVQWSAGLPTGLIVLIQFVLRLDVEPNPSWPIHRSPSFPICKKYLKDPTRSGKPSLSTKPLYTTPGPIVMLLTHGIAFWEWASMARRSLSVASASVLSNPNRSGGAGRCVVLPAKEAFPLAQLGLRICWYDLLLLGRGLPGTDSKIDPADFPARLSDQRDKPLPSAASPAACADVLASTDVGESPAIRSVTRETAATACGCVRAIERRVWRRRKLRQLRNVLRLPWKRREEAERGQHACPPRRLGDEHLFPCLELRFCPQGSHRLE